MSSGPKNYREREEAEAEAKWLSRLAVKNPSEVLARLLVARDQLHELRQDTTMQMNHHQWVTLNQALKELDTLLEM